MRGRADRWFLVAALVVLLLGGGMAVYLATMAGNSSTGVRELQSYHIEAVVTSSNANRNQLVRIWYQAPDKLRVEAGFDGAVPSVYVIDGQTMRVYNAATNTYYDQGKPAQVLQARGNTTMALGPLPDDTLGAYFDPQQGGTWDVTGRDKVLGHEVEVVERDLRTVAQGSLARYWIDPRYLFVMRYESTTASGKTTWQPTAVEYNPQIDPQLFVFTPPAGARKAASPSPSGGGIQTGPPSASPSYTLPMGFLKPSYVPDGYTVAAISQSVTSGSSGNSSKVTVRYSGPATGNATSSLSIEQTQGGPGLQEAPSGATKVDVNGATGYETTLSAVHVLSWQAPGSGAGGAVGVVLRSPSLSFEELLKVARSMK